jgi:hypothetical protein
MSDVADIYRLPRRTQDDACRTFALGKHSGKTGCQGSNKEVTTVHGAEFDVDVDVDVDVEYVWLLEKANHSSRLDVFSKALQP